METNVPRTRSSTKDGVESTGGNGRGERVSQNIVSSG